MRIRRLRFRIAYISVVVVVFLAICFTFAVTSGRWEENNKSLPVEDYPEEVKMIKLTDQVTEDVRRENKNNTIAHVSFRSRDTDLKAELDSLNRPAIAMDRPTFQESVLQRIDARRVIFLVYVDSGYSSIAVNLYLTSFLPFRIFNFLFVSTDPSDCNFLVNYGNLPCYTHFVEKEGNYDLSNFRRKTRHMTKIVLDALLLGVTVVIVDADIVFFKNPMPYLNCTSCDIQMPNHAHGRDAGIYMAHPSAAAIEFHEKALSIGIEGNTTRRSEKKAVRMVMDSMISSGRLKVDVLNTKVFPCGWEYFEKKGIMFLDDGRCDECVLVHNNGIVSREATIYRFRETGLWQVDINRYYSDPDRKYLVYDNPLDFGPENTLKNETDALIAALYIGSILNRIVILPTFHCYGCKYKACNNKRGRCALNTFYKIVDFDRYFGDLYREHVFLKHDKVPRYVKERQTGPVLIKSEINAVIFDKDDGSIDQKFVPKNVSAGATVSEIKSWFEEDYAAVSILRFHSLYGTIRMVADKEFSRRMSKALKSSDYRQH